MGTPVSTPLIAAEARRDVPEFVRAGERLMWIDGRAVAAASGQTLPNTDQGQRSNAVVVHRGRRVSVGGGTVVSS